MSGVTRALDRWFGRGEFSVTTPPMDGAFRPNDALDAADIACKAPAPDALAATSRGLLVSSGTSLLNVERQGETAAVFDQEITALCGLPNGGGAIALADGQIRYFSGTTLPPHPEIRCVTALAPGADGALLIANGSSRFAPADWKRDLMAANATGSVWRYDGAYHKLAGDLAYPYGLVEDSAGIVVSESWRARLIRIRPGAKRPEAALEVLPAYPSRIARSPDGGFWLALFAPRSQLLEFVLRERQFRERMTAGIDPEFWVAPSLRSGRSPLEPTQQGGVKQLGVLKPWSPTRSYGLAAKLDAALRPIASLHSRANGRRHGVTACLAHEGQVYFAAKGDGVVAAFAATGAKR